MSAVRRILLLARRRRRAGERGAATAFLVGMTVVLLACAGLVVDGGGALNARMKLADEVEQAARAGAQMIDQDVARGEGRIALNVSEARARATGFLTARGYRVNDVAVNGTTVTVSAEDTVDTRLLTLVGIENFDISATATADAVTQ